MENIIKDNLFDSVTDIGHVGGTPDHGIGPS
jgi:hypothetical protein